MVKKCDCNSQKNSYTEIKPASIYGNEQVQQRSQQLCVWGKNNNRRMEITEIKAMIFFSINCLWKIQKSSSDIANH